MCVHISRGYEKCTSATTETGLLNDRMNAVRSLDRRPTALAEHSHAKVVLEKKKQKLLHCVAKKPYIKTTLEEKNGNT